MQIRYILASISLLFLFLLHVSAEGNPDIKKGLFVVVIDPGHGGKDPGAIGSNRNNCEKNINLGIAKKLGALIQANCNDTKVIYTRSTDVFVELGRRAEIANKAKADLFISIHTNALPKGARKATGVQSYTLTLNTSAANLEVEKRENSVIEYEEDGAKRYGYDGSTESAIMIELMQDHDMERGVEFAKLCQNEMVNTGKRRDMGVQQANFLVLRQTYMPSVLLEVGFISTPSEEVFLISNSGQEKLAKCIYNAFVHYKKQQTGMMSKLEEVQQDNDSEKHVATEVKPTNSEIDNSAGIASATSSSESTKAETTEAENKEPEFRIQLLVSDKKLKNNDRQFKGVAVDYYVEGKQYKYTHGKTSDYNEIRKLRTSIASKFPGAFIIAFKNGLKIPNTEAINEWKRNKKR